jgi:hypothetical protein
MAKHLNCFEWGFNLKAPKQFYIINNKYNLPSIYVLSCCYHLHYTAADDFGKYFQKILRPSFFLRLVGRTLLLSVVDSSRSSRILVGCKGEIN